MAKITREQLNKWNAQAQGGFSFDFRHFCIWHEKRLRKTVEQRDNNVVEFVIDYRAEIEEKTSEYGCKYKIETGRHIPVLRVSVWHPSGNDGVYVSHGMGAQYDIGDAQNKQRYDVLCKLSGAVNTDDYMPEQYRTATA